LYEPKMKENDASVIEFIENVEQPKKREDAYKLLEVFEEATGYKAKMWGTSIIGFGSFHYRYKSGHEGDAPYVGFSPRKAKISLYLAPEDSDTRQLLKDFGKHTTGKSCVYINKLDDVNIDILRKMIKRAVIYTNELYPQEHGI
jgi:hypothetical protein